MALKTNKLRLEMIKNKIKKQPKFKSLKEPKLEEWKSLLRLKFTRQSWPMFREIITQHYETHKTPSYFRISASPSFLISVFVCFLIFLSFHSHAFTHMHTLKTPTRHRAKSNVCLAAVQSTHDRESKCKDSILHIKMLARSLIFLLQTLLFFSTNWISLTLVCT